MERSVQLALFLLLSFPVLSLARGRFRSSHPTSAASSFCALTHDPRLCMMAVANFPTANNIEAVLRSNLKAINNMCTSAEKRVPGLVWSLGPTRAAKKKALALKNCADLYRIMMDHISMANRAMGNNNRSVVKFMLQEAWQSAGECNALFQFGGYNPLAHVNSDLIKMTKNADDLNNAMNSRNAARRS